MSDKEKNLEIQQKENDVIIESGQLALKNNEDNVKIHLLSIIGEVEGHDVLPSNSKTTKYEHVLPKLAQIEDDKEYKGVLLIINTVGGDVESGLAIAEMIASLSKPQFHWYWEVVIQLEYHLLFQQIILLLCHQEQWLFILSE